MQQVSVSRVAQEAGVSPALVSRFVNQDPDLWISDDKRIRIITAAERLGGMPVGRGARRRLRTRTHTIFMPIGKQQAPDWKTGLSSKLTYHQFLQALNEELNEQNHQLAVTFFDEQRRTEQIHRLIEPPTACEGLILSRGVINLKLARELWQVRMPHVGLDDDAEALGLNSILVNQNYAFTQAILHLQTLGHKRIIYVGPRENTPNYTAVLSAFVNAGLPVSENEYCFINAPQETHPDWRKAAHEPFYNWLNQKHDVTAAVFFNDELLLGAIDIMRQQGVAPGRDLSLIGYGNIEQRLGTNPHDPIISTIDYPVESIARRCVASLFRQTEREQTTVTNERVLTHVINRSTTWPAPNRR